MIDSVFAASEDGRLPNNRGRCHRRLPWIVSGLAMSAMILKACGKAWSRNQILQMNSWNPILRWLKHHVWYFSPHYDWLICPIYPLILPIYTPHLSQLPWSCDVKAVMLADEKQHGVEKSVVYRVREGTINPWINAGLCNVMGCNGIWWNGMYTWIHICIYIHHLLMVWSSWLHIYIYVIIWHHIHQ